MSCNNVDRLANDFIEHAYGDVERHVSLKKFSYWKIGGNISAIFYPNSIEAVVFLREKLTNLNINHLLIGRTSNILFTSSKINGVFVCLGRHLNSHEIKGDSVFAFGGASVPWLAYKVGSRGLSGIEHIVGIPGTLGGLTYMNGGSLRKAIGENIKSVTLVDSESIVKVVSNEDCWFTYRNSSFQELNDWVVAIELKLTPGPRKLIKSNMLEILKGRRQKFPLHLPSCGSVFKSNTLAYEKVGPPGVIIEKLGLKGCVSGGAEISKEHANFIVNYNGKATSKDVAELIYLIQKEAKRVFDLTLEAEAKYLDSNCKLHSLSEYVSINGVNI